MSLTVPNIEWYLHGRCHFELVFAISQSRLNTRSFISLNLLFSLGVLPFVVCMKASEESLVA